jgi:hypothetical protein
MPPADARRADWDGDDFSDLNIYRSSQWHFVRSHTGAQEGYNWGRPTDVPVLGDYDADAKADLTIWRPASGQWATLKSSAGFGADLWSTWGSRGSVPVPGDYDGDGITDRAYWTRPGGVWTVQGSFSNVPPFQWGAAGDEPVQTDYDGDQKTDFAVWRPSTGEWIIWRSLTNDWVAYPWGAATDIPVPGNDYDNDNKADITVYRARTGQWLYLLSTLGYSASEFRSYTFSPGGDSDPLAATDIPVTGAFPDPDTQTFSSSFALWRPSTGIWTSTNPNRTGPPVTRPWGLGAPPYLDFPVNGYKRVPFVSPVLARALTSVSFETTALTVPPNVASCGPDGAAFLSGTPNVVRNSLSCWKSGANCNQTSFDLSTLDVPPFVPPGAEDNLGGTSDNNIIRMNNGRLLLEHLAVRFEPTVASGSNRQGIAIFFDSGTCGESNGWTIKSSLTKSDLGGGDWKRAQLDMGHLFNNPYSGRVYFTVQNHLENKGVEGNQSLLFYSDDFGGSWTKWGGQPALSYFPLSYVMASSPNQRQYVFGCSWESHLPTIYVFSEATNSLAEGTWTSSWPTDAANTCDSSPAGSLGIEGSRQISLISSEEDGDYLRIMYPQRTGNTQRLHMANIRVTGTASQPEFTMISENILSASAGSTASIYSASLISPDMLEVGTARQTNTSLLYWLESDGPLAGDGSSADPGVRMTVKGMILRDLNLWAPIFHIVGDDVDGTPLAWTGWTKAGDYVRAGFAYDSASDMLNFFPIWANNGTWNTNMISAHP